MRFYSQYSQDKYLYDKFFNTTRDGVFVDVGAHDGISLNNTLFFEESLNWNGINIEPIPLVFEKLKENRPKCINLNCAISNENTENAPFILGHGYTEMLSGLLNSYDPRHYERMNREIIQYGGKNEIINVKTRSLESIFDEYNIRHVQYLTIDAEGGESNIIKSINFNKVFIDIIQFEDNYDNTGIVEYLNSQGYIYINKETDIFMIHKNSKYNM